MNFLSPSNKVAFLRDGKVVLEKSNLEAIVNQAIQENTGGKSLPLAIISVLDSNKSDPTWQKLHTDWILYFHEHKQSSNLPLNKKTWESTYKLEYFDSDYCENKGAVYIWPKAFTMTQTIPGTLKQMMCWIVYVEDDLEGNELLEQFVACFSSKVFLWSQTQQEDIQNILKCMEDETISSSKELIVPSSCLMLLTDKTSISSVDTTTRGIGVHFLKNDYEKLEIDPMVTSSSGTLTLNNFVDHLKQVTSKFNKMGFSYNQHPNLTSDQNINNYPEINNNSSLGNMRPRKSADRKLKRSDTQEDSFDADGDDVNHQLKSWIAHEMTIFNINKMCDGVDVPDASKWVLVEFQNIMVLFNRELQSMFDNYVCFSGELDEKIMTRLSDNAVLRFKKGYESIADKLSNSMFSPKILKRVPTKLYQMHRKDNEMIAEYEKILSEKVRNGLLKIYTNCMLSYHHKKTGADYTLSELKAVHRRITRQAISTMSRCLDYPGRLNTLSMEAAQNVQLHLEEEFNRHKGILSIRTDRDY